MKNRVLFIAACVLIRGASLFAYPTVFLQTFDSYASAKADFGDTTYYKLRADTFGLCAQVTNTDSTKSVYISKTLSIDSLKGYRILISAWAKASGLTKKPANNNGVKIMAYFKTATGVQSWPQLKFPDTLRSFGWTRPLPLLVSVPDNATTLTITLGLELVAGAASFDSIEIRKASSIAMPPPRDSTMPVPTCAPTRLRGAMIGVPPDSSAIGNFGDNWKGNLLRWQMNGGTQVTFALQRSDYATMFRQEISYLDKGLPVCRAHGIKVVVDMHQMSTGLFIDTAAQSLLIASWKTLAEHYKDSAGVWGYDLANEPAEDSWREGALFWNELADTLARTIRAVDPVKPIIVEPVGGGLTMFETLRPVGCMRGYDVPNVVYSFHYYNPGTLTGQGLTGGPPLGAAVYPGTIGGIAWDSAYMRQDMAAAVAYQRKYRVPIYVGEFSCIRWAPQKSAFNWLTDVTRILESYGWHWSYHAYREFQGWSVEYGDSMNVLTTPVNTDRKALLLSYYAQNQNPYAATEIKAVSSSEKTGLSMIRVSGNASSRVVIGKIPRAAVVFVSDIRGRQVAVVKPENGIATISNRECAPGFYVCRIVKSGMYRIVKIMVSE